jgi:cyclic pyranopterin phosphate synthase
VSRVLSVEKLSHLTASGDVHMVDVGAKEATDREGVAEAIVAMSTETRDRLFAGDLEKGDALATIRIAGIMAAKRTADLIPLCHPLSLTAAAVEVAAHPKGARIVATVRTSDRTGVEMEAMTAAAVAALAMYDMVKGLERGVTIEAVGLVRKSGGRSGTWERS